jgi:DNA-binding protein WhiA
MSFSGEIRSELARQVSGARHCQLSELFAMMEYSGAMPAPGEAPEAIEFRTEYTLVAEKYFRLLKKLFGAEPELAVKQGSRKNTRRYLVRLSDGESIRKIMAAAEKPPVRRDCCRRAYIRGAFLVCGSVSDPNRSYHMEFVCGSRTSAARLLETVAETGVHPKMIRRRNDFVVYLKEIAEISELIGRMGSRVGLMNLENIRILKEMRGNVNRKVNCETANINKTVSAAVRQIEDIRLIEERVGLDTLPNGLDEMARVRLQYPEASLQELGEVLDPPVGKSGVNHRLRRLGDIAARLRGGMEGD